MKTETYLKEFYENYDEDGRLTLPWGRIEYITTMKYIEKYLRPGMHVLEVGAATGRYSHALARQGYEVDAVELLQHNIELFNRNTQPGERVSVRQGNAMDLSAFPDSCYDITLLLGPLYHLYNDEDKGRALREAVRVTRPGGVIFAAYCMVDPSIVIFGFQQGNIHSLIEKGMLDPVTFAGSSDPSELFEVVRTDDIKRLRGTLPVTPLHLVASDGYTNHMRQTMEQMDEKTYRLYLDYHLAVCERQDLIGFSHHTLDIFRKNEA